MLLDYLSKNMLLEPSFIEMVAKSSSSRYFQTTIKKQDGTDRKICQPSRELKSIQRVIHDDILSKLPIHSAVYAYRKGINLKKHVLAHQKSNFVTRLDFKNFFNSIDIQDISTFINSHSNHIDQNWTNADTKLLVKLVTYKGALTIGSVTSPIISNSICHQLDEQIHQLCCNLDVTYSRYADDLYFSTNTPNILFTIQSYVIRIVRNISYPHNLWLNKKKTIHTSKKRLRKITGLVLTTDGKVSIGREKKRVLRSNIYKWDSLGDTEKISLKGYLAFVSSVEPDLINRLCNKYGSKKIYDIIKFTIKPVHEKP